jgi:hypothetical protein
MSSFFKSPPPLPPQKKEKSFSSLFKSSTPLKKQQRNHHHCPQSLSVKTPPLLVRKESSNLTIDDLGAAAAMKFIRRVVQRKVPKMSPAEAEET